MRIYITKKITVTVKNRLHSRQQPCRSPRLTVIGIGLRKISSKFCLPSVRAARRHCRCLAFRLFCLSVHFFYMRAFPRRLPALIICIPRTKKAPASQRKGRLLPCKKALGIDRRLIHARQLSVAASHEFEHDGGLDGIMKRIESQMSRNVIAVRLLKSRADGSDVEGSRF